MTRRPVGDPPELIPDAAIQNVEDDRLGLDAVAGVVVDLASRVITPATIAVFGAWGSGKTSLGHLIRRRLEDPDGPIDATYVYFNAWKYSEAPLRRHFLTRAAQALGAGKGYSRGLYARSKTTKYSVTGQTAKFIILLSLAVLGTFVLLVLASQFVVWSLSGSSTDLGQQLLSTLSTSAGALLLSTAVLAPVLTFLLNQMRVEEDLSEPSSDEQFDELFSALVSKHVPKSAIALFYIDELDRAPASQSVLETFKTFLDQPRCVFVVAADKVVLEEAVAANDDLAAPENASAYYSSGSAYLDKIFEYQIHLPAFENRLLTQFALSLVNERGGVWRSLGDQKATVVSILIPSHIRSPRRAKVLLNGYVLSVRTARERLGVQLVDRDYLELAKLTCIRTEFPLFYRDLEQLPSLAELTTAVIIDDQDRIAAFGGSSELMTRAREYASTRQPADVELAQEDPRTPTGTQLVDYLRRTRNIELRNWALLYMRPPGQDVGLAPEVATDLAIASKDGAANDAVSAIAALPQGDRERAISHLTRILEDSVGLEIPNAAATLLTVAESHADELTIEGAADVLGAVSRTQVWQSLDPVSVAALLRVATKLAPASRRGYEANLFARAEEGSGWGAPLIVGYGLLSDDSRAEARGLLARYITDDPVVAMNALNEIDPSTYDDLFDGGPAESLSTTLADASAPKGAVQSLAERVLPVVSPATQWSILGPVLATSSDVVIARNDAFLRALPKAEGAIEAEAALAAIAKQPTNLVTALDLLPVAKIEVDRSLVMGAVVACAAFAAEAEEPEPVIASASNLGQVIPDDLDFASLEDELDEWTDGSWVGDPGPRIAQHNVLLAVGGSAESVSPGFGDILVDSAVGGLAVASFPNAARDELERLIAAFLKVRPTDPALYDEMAVLGVVLRSSDLRGVAEEAAFAYKDIESVMAASASLVRPTKRLTPMGVVKG